MLRVTVSFAIAFCVITCVATAVLGVRSGTIADQVVWRGDDSTVIITSTRGRLDIGWWQTSIRPLPPMESPVLSYIVSPAYPLYEPDPGWLGFVVRTGEQSLWWGTSAPATRVRASHSTLAILFTMFPAGILLIRVTRRLRRIRTDHCPSCGYDLRGSVSGCPECVAVSRARG